jgi:hypothetical protein
MKEVLWGEYKRAADDAAYCARVLERVWSTPDKTEWAARAAAAEAKADAAWGMWAAA